MLIVTVAANGGVIEKLEIINRGPYDSEDDLRDYEVRRPPSRWRDPEALGTIQHRRSEGAEKLAAAALMLSRTAKERKLAKLGWR